MWDARTLKSTRCLAAFGGEAVTSLACTSNGAHIWAAAGSRAFLFDLRRADVVLLTADATVAHNTDEINAIAVHPKGDFIATCDDSGEVKLFEPIRHTCVRTLRSRHTNICSALAFHATRGHEIVTGGMDCQAIVWDTHRGRALHTLATGGAAPSSGVNPPFVHALAMRASGDECAFGLGNAEVLLFSLPTRTETRRLRGHTSPVAAVYVLHARC